jgi:glycosyltransferase involved in cell wall biosynthesis
MNKAIWHILDVRAIWIKEFAAALAQQTPTLGWCPRLTGTAVFRNHEAEVELSDPKLRIRYFPLQRGFAKFPVRGIVREADRITRRLMHRTENPSDSVLICSTPHYAAVAERWPGPVVYYVTDLFAAYGEDTRFIRRLDRTMCRAATLVCPNSRRIAAYLTREAQCPATKIVIVPNATRSTNVVEQSAQPGKLPNDTADLPRPIAGVIGNLAANMDWVLLRKIIDQTPWLSWVFVGPTEMPVADPQQRTSRRYLMGLGGRVRFVGPKSYAELQAYARSFNVAILPYRKVEPTYSGSSTRFYEHLAAGSPILATRGFEELLHKEPLLRLIDSDGQMTTALEELCARDFRDGYEDLRWRASQTETWEARARQIRSAVLETISQRYEIAQTPMKELSLKKRVASVSPQ